MTPTQSPEAAAKPVAYIPLTTRTAIAEVRAELDQLLAGLFALQLWTRSASTSELSAGQLLQELQGKLKDILGE